MISRIFVVLDTEYLKLLPVTLTKVLQTRQLFILSSLFFSECFLWGLLKIGDSKLFYGGFTTTFSSCAVKPFRNTCHVLPLFFQNYAAPVTVHERNMSLEAKVL